MKKRIILLALLLLLAGCSGAPAADVAVGEDRAQEQEVMDASLVETQARPLTQTEILSAYNRAVTAYGWFDLSPLPCTQEIKTVDGWLYQKVDYPGIEDLADLRAYLRVVFSEELTERLLEQGDHPVYRDVDGVLYATAGVGREKDSEQGFRGCGDRPGDRKYLFRGGQRGVVGRLSQYRGGRGVLFLPL